MLGWQQVQLAQAAGVSRPTVMDFEKGQRIPIPVSQQSIRRALEEAGIEFLDEDGGGRGVRFRHPHAETSEDAEGSDAE